MKFSPHIVPAFLLLAGLSPILAQQTPASSVESNASENTVVLSPFEVRSGEEGYGSASSTGASRIAIPITDLSSSVITINEKLIDDLVAVSADETLNLVGGVNAYAETQSQDTNRFSLRGYTSSTAQRDGFTDVLYGSFGGFNYTFVERMEVLKGPNGILYGESSPGGILNLVSKRPLPKPRTRVSLMAGSDAFYRADLDTSGFLDSNQKFGYRLATSLMYRDGPLDHPGDVNKGKPFFAINPVLRYRFDNGLEIWGWSGFVRDQTPRLRPTTKGFRTPDGRGGYLAELVEGGGGKHILTNGAEVQTDSYEVGATKGFDLGSVRLDVRVLGRHTEQLNQSTFVNATGGIDVYVDQAGAVIGRDSRTIDYDTVVGGKIAGIYRAVALQLTGNQVYTDYNTLATDFGFTFKLGKIENKLLVFGTYDEFSRNTMPGIDGNVYQVRTLSKLASLGVEIVNNEARIWTYPMAREVLAGITPEAIIANFDTQSASLRTLQDTEQFSYGAVERASFWNNRIIGVVGARFTGNDTTTQTGTTAAQDTTDKTWTYSYGAVYKFLQGEVGTVAAFVNANETFVPVFTIDRRLATYGEKFPNRMVKIKEAGLKFDLWKNKLVASGSVYKTSETNVLQTFEDVDGSITGETGRSYSVPSGNGTTKGWDVDLAYTVTRGLDLIASYGRMNARLDTGMRTIGQPDATAAFMARYQIPKGPLKNFSVAWNYTWWGDSMLDSRTNWTIPAGYVHNVILGYKWKNLSARLRIGNVFDEIKFRPSTQETAVGVTDGRDYRFSLDYRW